MTTVTYIAVAELAASLGTDQAFIRELEVAGLVEIRHEHSGADVLSEDDAETVRLSLVLTTELEVNLAGVEVILHMRENMVSMQRQFAEVLASIARDVMARRR